MENLLSIEFLENLFPGHTWKRVVLNCYVNSGSRSPDFDKVRGAKAKGRFYVGYVNSNYLNTAILYYDSVEVLRVNNYTAGQNSLAVFNYVDGQANNLCMFQFIGYEFTKKGS